MALLFCDSFDHYTTAADMAGKYPPPGAPPTSFSISTTGGRRGGGCLVLNSSVGNAVRYVTPTGATAITGVAMKTAAASDGICRVDIGDSAVQHVSFRLMANGSWAAYRGNAAALLGQTAAGVYNFLSGFQYFEFKTTIDDSAGMVQIRMNGADILAPVTGIDTRNGGASAAWNWVQIYGLSGANSSWDDFYICDTSGSFSNDFLGDIRIDCHYPTANGTTSNSTPSTGTNRGLTVDETTPNTTDYNTLTAIGDKDTLVLADLVSVGATPKAAQVTIYAAKTDAGVASLCPVIRHSGTDYDGPSAALDTTFRYNIVYPMASNPAGGAWTESDFNALEVGYKRTA